MVVAVDAQLEILFQAQVVFVSGQKLLPYQILIHLEFGHIQLLQLVLVFLHHFFIDLPLILILYLPIQALLLVKLEVV